MSRICSREPIIAEVQPESTGRATYHIGTRYPPDLAWIRSVIEARLEGLRYTTNETSVEHSYTRAGISARIHELQMMLLTIDKHIKENGGKEAS